MPLSITAKKPKASLRRKLRGVKAGRIGTKARDMRFMGPDGQEYASRFEYVVFDAYRRSGTPCRRTIKGSRDTLSYTLPVRNATCGSCGSDKIGQQRKYTPDLFHDGDPERGGEQGYFIEVKGYLRAPQRSLLRAFCKARPDVNLRFILQRDFPISKSSTISVWISRFLKKKWVVWDGKIPEKWNG